VEWLERSVTGSQRGTSRATYGSWRHVVIDLVREYGVLRFGGMTAAFLFVLASIVLVMASHG
jgi:hypothetical protein